MSQETGAFARVDVTPAATEWLRKLSAEHVDGSPWYIGGKQFELWSHTHLTLDAVPGRGAGFSLEAPHGIRFVINSRLLTPAELDALPEPPRGPQH